MLEFFRRGVKSWVAKALLFLLIISFAVWGIEGVFAGGGLNRTVASVGDAEIDGQDFALAVQRRQNQLIQERRQAVSLQDVRDNGDARRILDAMILDTAISEELGGLDVDIPDDAVLNAILTDPRFADSRGQFDQRRYGQHLNANGYDQQGFEAETRRRLRREILLDAVIPGDGAPTGMAERVATWSGETRKIAMIGLDAGTAPDPGKPDDAALAAFFEADSDPFIEPERRWGQYVAIDMVALTAELTPTEADAKAEFDSNPEAYSQPAARVIEQIEFSDQDSADKAAARLITGEATFAEIAAEQNIALDDLSLGAIGENDTSLPDATRAAVFALTEPGLAGPIKTPIGGYVLLNVTQVQLGGAPPFDDIKDALIQSLAVQRARAEAPARASRIDELRAGGAELPEIAQDLKVPLVAFQGLGPDSSVAEGEVPALAGNERFMRELTEALEGEERDLVQLPDGSYVLVMVDKIVATHLPKLDDIKDRVIQAWQQDQRLKALEDKGTALIDAKTEGGLAAIASDQDAEVQEPAAFARRNAPRTLSNDLINAAFKAPAGSIVTGRTRDGAQVMLVEVREITPLEGDALAERVAATRDQLQGRATIDSLEMFARDLQANTPISVSDEAIDGVFEYLDNMMRGGYGHGGM